MLQNKKHLQRLIKKPVLTRLGYTDTVCYFRGRDTVTQPENRLQRESYRVSFIKEPLIINYTFDRIDGPRESLSGKVLDLSSRGMHVVGMVSPDCTATITEESQLSCTVVLSDEATIQVKTRIRWFKKCHSQKICNMGLEITDISDAHKNLLKLFLIRKQMKKNRNERSLEDKNAEYRSR